jgi:hypothetical protein
MSLINYAQKCKASSSANMEQFPQIYLGLPISDTKLDSLQSAHRQSGQTSCSLAKSIPKRLRALRPY